MRQLPGTAFSLQLHNSLMCRASSWSSIDTLSLFDLRLLNNLGQDRVKAAC